MGAIRTALQSREDKDRKKEIPEMSEGHRKTLMALNTHISDQIAIIYNIY